MTVTRSASGKLIIERKGPVTTVTLNRPEKHNALDREVSAELNAAVKEINVDRECRVVVFKGAGDTFCAGDDIKEFNDWTPQDGPWQVRLYQETVNIIENMYAITIAAVDGICTGGGLELFFQAEDGIRDLYVTGVQTCALPISDDIALRRRLSFLLKRLPVHPQGRKT